MSDDERNEVPSAAEVSIPSSVDPDAPPNTEGDNTDERESDTKADTDSYRENYARIGTALDKLLEIDGVDFKTNIDINDCYRGDEYTEATVTLVVDDDVLNGEGA